MKNIKYILFSVLVMLSFYSCSTLNSILNQMNVQKRSLEQKGKALGKEVKDGQNSELLTKRDNLMKKAKFFLFGPEK